MSVRMKSVVRLGIVDLVVYGRTLIIIIVIIIFVISCHFYVDCRFILCWFMFKGCSVCLKFI